MNYDVYRHGQVLGTHDRYINIKTRILDIANSDEGIKAIIAIGSSTRSEWKADEYSDLDLIIVAEDTESWLYGSIPEQLGDVKISFVEYSLGGAKERRVLYEDILDVDMIVLTPEQFTNAIQEGVAGWVCNRGYSVLYDTMGFGKLLAENMSCEIKYNSLTESEYINMVNDFCFHTVWASKKILRGELWTAKMCIDAYLKNYLLKVIEMHSVCKYNTDVWHDGRFLDRWVDNEIKKSLKKCFAHYEKEDMISALFETKNLFVQLAKTISEISGYEFPETVVNHADKVLSMYFCR